jgi:hypothetical protein
VRTTTNSRREPHPPPYTKHLPATMPTDKDGIRRQATTLERVAVIEMRANGESYRSIAAKTSFSESGARKVVSDWPS